MTDELNEQAVAETPDEQAPPASEDTGAQDNVQDDGDNLDELLREYETGTARQEEQAPPAADVNVVATLESQIKALQAESAAERDIRDKRDIEALVDDFAKGAPLSRRLVRGAINDIALEDSKISEAFQMRYQNPQVWDAAKKRLSKKFAEELKAQPDKELSENREAVANAVRGHSKRQPEQDDINTREIAEMSDSQFEAWVRTQKK